MTRAFEHVAPGKVVVAPAGLEPLEAELDALGARRVFSRRIESPAEIQAVSEAAW